MRRPPRSTRTYTLLPDTTLFRSLRGARFMDHLEGAGLARGDRVDFDCRVPLEFRGAQICSEGGLLVMRELDDVLGLSNLASEALRHCRRGQSTLHQLEGLFRPAVFGRLAGYADLNDARRLSVERWRWWGGRVDGGGVLAAVVVGVVVGRRTGPTCGGWGSASWRRCSACQVGRRRISETAAPVITGSIGLTEWTGSRWWDDWLYTRMVTMPIAWPSVT